MLFGFSTILHNFIRYSRLTQLDEAARRANARIRTELCVIFNRVTRCCHNKVTRPCCSLMREQQKRSFLKKLLRYWRVQLFFETMKKMPRPSPNGWTSQGQRKNRCPLVGCGVCFWRKQRTRHFSNASCLIQRNL